MRSRKALQYANSIDDYVRIMKEGNNGGYANDWLIGDHRDGRDRLSGVRPEEHTTVAHQRWLLRQLQFCPRPESVRQETTFDPNDASASPNARHARWEEIMKQAKGKIDVAMAQQFLSDHFDSFRKKTSPTNEGCADTSIHPREG